MNRFLFLMSVTLFVSVSSAWGKHPLEFDFKLLVVDTNEGCDIGDIDGDGKPDIVAGRNWYRNPDWTPRPVRTIEDWAGYCASNCDFLYDVDEDGLLDVVSGGFVDPEVAWYRNPGGEALMRGEMWPRRLLADTGGKSNEFSMMHDFDGDGLPEWVTNSWTPRDPLRIYRWQKSEDGKLEGISLTEHLIGANQNGHGMGFGDVNNDGREDILVGTGWYERPAGDIWQEKWIFHADWNGSLSCPVIVRDVNGDGKNDIIVGAPHDYGLKVWIATGNDPNKFTYTEQVMDQQFSQLHCLHMADLDGDGREELITGKRVRAHNGKDPGGLEPPIICYYTIDEQGNFTRHDIQRGIVGIGLQIRTADLNGDGKLDIVVAGKDGTQILIQK